MRLHTAAMASILFSSGLICLASPAQPVQASAQTSTTQQNNGLIGVYNLKFVVTRTRKGQVAEQRTYNAVYGDKNLSGMIRADTRVPVDTASHATAVANAQVSTQYQYIDTGVDIDFSHAGDTRQVDGVTQLVLRISAQVSSYTPAPAGSYVTAPLISTDRWVTELGISPGRPHLLFSSQSPSSDQTTEVELTATRVP